jgi:hypothetical protein
MIEMSHVPVELSTYIDPKGVLRSKTDDSCVVWHYKSCVKTGIHPSEIVYDPASNIPWCPLCWQNKKALEVLGSKLK